MRVVMFYHSLLSDWNHGNAHFLRGVATELLARGHEVKVYEPRDAWSVENLLAEYGTTPLEEFRAAYPQLESTRYELAALDLEETLEGAGLVLVHEWNDPALVARVGGHRARVGGYRLLFHDTHHRAVTAPEEMAAYDLRHYDGVLAFGRCIRDIYLERGWAARAWTWHEAADTRVFKPLRNDERAAMNDESSDSARGSDSSSITPHSSFPYDGDVVWVGNWGDDERTAELHEFLLRPVKELGLRARVYGVRYPAEALSALRRAGAEYRGWLPNFRVPEVFARFKATVHVPRRPYVEGLPGIPTIRPFEALACGIPLVCSPWNDAEGLFTPGEDFLVARDGGEMKRHLSALVEDEGLRRTLAAAGLRTIRARHTCAHRADELLSIYDELENLKEEEEAAVA